jgi:hypothetical protein
MDAKIKDDLLEAADRLEGDVEDLRWLASVPSGPAQVAGQRMLPHVERAVQTMRKASEEEVRA